LNELGDLLRSEREKKGLSLEEVEEATRIRRRYLEALENGDAAHLPAPVYTQGFIRNYAIFLGLAPQEALALFRGAEPVSPPVAPLQGALRAANRPNWILVIGLLIGLAAVALLIVWGVPYYRDGQAPAVPSPSGEAATATPLPASATPVPPTATASATPPIQPTLLPTFTATVTPVAGVQVQVIVTDKSWLRVTVDGQVAYEGTLEAGETHTWTGKDAVTMLSGNAAGTSVIVNGKSQAALGAPGQVVELTWSRP
jgi:cytoskeleton protein RodZ